MKKLLITGASRGIGRETVKTLASMGHYVVAVSRSTRLLQELKEQFGNKIDIATVDLSIKQDLNRIVHLLNEKKIILDGVLHNAGKLINRPFDKLEDSDWKEMIDVNLMGPVQLTRILLPYMKQKSHILHISSMGGYQNSSKFPGLSAYSATKGALAILSECLAVEFSEKKIYSNCLCLGTVQTEMLEEAFPGIKADVTAEEMANYIANFLLTGHDVYNGKVLPVALSDPE